MRTGIAREKQLVVAQLRPDIHTRATRRGEVDEEHTGVLRCVDIAHGELDAVAIVVGHGERTFGHHGHERRSAPLVRASGLKPTHADVRRRLIAPFRELLKQTQLASPKENAPAMEKLRTSDAVVAPTTLGGEERAAIGCTVSVR